MASAEAVQRRRDNRAALRRGREVKNAERLKAVSGGIISATSLTDKEQATLKTITEPLFNAGVIHMRYMGLRFLELFKLGWTPMRYVMVNKRVEVSGIWCSEYDFELVWAWWGGLSREERSAVIRASRFVRRII